VGELHAAPGAATPGEGGAPGLHTPVMLERCLELIAPALDRDDAVHVDATLGLGGHAEAVLVRHPHARVIGLDRDPHALAHSRQRLAAFGDRITLVHAVYDELPTVLGHIGLTTVDSILFDLGVSSMQLDQADRGFSYAQDAPLDMRMDQTTGITAEEVVNTYPPGDLARILRVYGEEKFALRIANAIVRERTRSRIVSSARLAELVRESIPAPARRTGGHPAKRAFQALRIEVNGELAALESALPRALDALSLGGRVVVMAYQSLEDRMVKRAFAERARSSAPVDLPVELPGTGPSLKLLTRSAELAGEDEVAENPRAASVRLRAAERIDPNATTVHKAAMKPGRTRVRPKGTEPEGSRDTTANRPKGTEAARRPGAGGAEKGEGR